MPCCKCCCGNKDCAEGGQGKCCCGGSCCQEGQYCCEGACRNEPCCGCSNAVIQTNVSSIDWTAHFTTASISGSASVTLGQQTQWGGLVTNTPNLFEFRQRRELPGGNLPFIPFVQPKANKRFGFVFLSFRRCPLDFFFSWSEWVTVTNPTFILPGVGACGARPPDSSGGCWMQTALSLNIFMRGSGGRGSELFATEAGADWLTINDPFCGNIESVVKTLSNASSSITFNFNPLP